MSPEASAINTLAIAADKAASRCGFCNEFGHTKWDCIRFVFSRLENIEIAIAEGGIPDMRPIVVILFIVLGGIVGGILGSIFTLAMRGHWS
jgi:hypothetical protein